MIRLIKNELKKILKKKSFYIVTIIFILYSLLTNVLYKNMDSFTNILDEKVNIEELKKENETLDLSDNDEALIYTTN